MSAANGYFNAYGNAARKDKHDYAIHLGDYLYETGRGGERATKPSGTIWTLGDYRTRHGLVCHCCVLVVILVTYMRTVSKRCRFAALV